MPTKLGQSYARVFIPVNEDYLNEIKKVGQIFWNDLKYEYFRSIWTSEVNIHNIIIPIQKYQSLETILNLNKKKTLH